SRVRSHLALAVAVAVAAGVACAEPPTPVAPPSEPPLVAPSDADETRRFGLVELARLPGVVELYDPGRWKNASTGSFTVLEHAPSRSALAVRVWRAARLVRPVDCEAEARLSRPS